MTEDEVAVIANKYGYIFKGNEKEEFTTLVSATCNAMQFVAEMDDYQPEADFNLTPREDIYFPKKRTIQTMLGHIAAKSPIKSQKQIFLQERHSASKIIYVWREYHVWWEQRLLQALRQRLMQRL